MSRSSKKSTLKSPSTESILQDDDKVCYICGYPLYGTKDKHHVFNGPQRSKAEEDRAYIFVHRQCHSWLHEHPKSMETMKIRGQKAWMKYYKKDVDAFIKRYGKNYLKEEDDGKEL